MNKTGYLSALMIGTDHLDARYHRSVAGWHRKLAQQPLHVRTNRIRFSTSNRDDPEIRPAISGDGNKVYAVFNRVISINGNNALAT